TGGHRGTDRDDHEGDEGVDLEADDEDEDDGDRRRRDEQERSSAEGLGPVVHRQTPSVHVGGTAPDLSDPNKAGSRTERWPEAPRTGPRRRVPARELRKAAAPLRLPALGSSRGEVRRGAPGGGGGSPR